MAVIPEQDDAQLVTTGMYRWARHPIYSLSILLMFATVLALPTAPMVFVASVHFLVMQRKARNEERHLHARFGSSYTRYCATVGRFWPRWS
jgi:protein-S-isoprenylcysteine O-methyltransferase Ste14